MTGEPPIMEHLAALREFIESGKVTPIIRAPPKCRDVRLMW
jgi:hypothetical protein